MLNCFSKTSHKNSIPIHVIPQQIFSTWFSKQPTLVKNWLTTIDFRGEVGGVSLVPDATGKLLQVICCVNDINNMWSVGALPLTLPPGVYHFITPVQHQESFAIAWGLGSYQFSRYKKTVRNSAQLILSKEINANVVFNTVEAIFLVRDLINTPTDDMGPTELAEVVVTLGKKFKATVTQIIGDQLLKKNFAAIHTVGRASDDPPRLIDLRWGNKKHPRVTLVGKGVCFDTGGLDIKNSSGMLLMKKDMGGAAHVLGLAQMIMAAKLPIYLRVLIPAVENAIAGNAYRPGDVIKSRKGLTIEIGNTDAEGRVILADALTEAASENPDLLIDISTLTGAARIALGTDLPALFSNHDELAHDLMKYGDLQQDPVWRMPLFSAYREALHSTIADINNNTADSYAGAITAALFLKEFVPEKITWVHLDLMAWNLRTRPGRPQGGEAMALRALYYYLIQKFARG